MHARVAPWVIGSAFVLGSLAYSMHAASFLHPKAAVFSAGALVMAALTQWASPRYAWQGMVAFAPLWLYLVLGAVRSLAGLSPAPYHTGAALLMLAPPLLFVSLARPWLTYGLVRRVVLLGAVSAAALALAQYRGWADWLFPPVPTYTQAMYSVFGNQDLLGGFLAVGLAVAVQGAVKKDGGAGWFIASIAVLLPAWLLAGSRTAWLAGVVGIVVGMACTGGIARRRAAWLGLAGVLAIAFIAALAPAATIERVTGTFGAGDEGGWFRLWIWDATLRMIAGSPLFGAGLGVFAYEAPRFLGEAFMDTRWLEHQATELTVYHAHSDPLEALAEMGLLGACLLGWMAWRLRHGRGEAWGPLTALLVFSCFNATVISPPHAVAGLMLASCLMPASRPTGTGWRKRPVTAFAGFLAVPVVLSLLIPSFQLRKAQTAHLEGRGAPEHYARIQPYAVLYPQAQTSRAQWHAEHEEWHAAIAAYERALGDVDTGRIHLELGALHHRTGQRDKARAHLEQAVARWPWNYDAWRLYGALLPEDEQAAALGDAARWLREDELAALEEALNSR